MHYQGFYLSFILIDLLLGDWEHQAFCKSFESSADNLTDHCDCTKSDWNVRVFVNQDMRI
jgi:hypothetical protein